MFRVRRCVQVPVREAEMKKTCFAAVVLLLLSGCAGPKVEFEPSLEAALRKAEKANKHLLIDFSSPG